MVLLRFLLAEMVNDINDTHHKRPNLAIKHFKSLPLSITVIPQDESPDKSDDQTNNHHNSTGIL